MDNSMLAKIGAIKVETTKVKLPERMSAKVKAIKSGSKKIKFEVRIFGDDTKLYSDKQIIPVPVGYCTKQSITEWKDAVKKIYEAEMTSLIGDSSFVEELVRKNSIVGVEFDDDEGTDKTLRDWILR